MLQESMIPLGRGGIGPARPRRFVCLVARGWALWPRCPLTFGPLEPGVPAFPACSMTTLDWVLFRGRDAVYELLELVLEMISKTSTVQTLCWT